MSGTIFKAGEPRSRGDCLVGRTFSAPNPLAEGSQRAQPYTKALEALAAASS